MTLVYSLHLPWDKLPRDYVSAFANQVTNVRVVDLEDQVARVKQDNIEVELDKTDANFFKLDVNESEVSNVFVIDDIPISVDSKVVTLNENDESSDELPDIQETDLNGLSYLVLKELCKNHKLKTTGKKAELIERLETLKR